MPLTLEFTFCAIALVLILIYFKSRNNTAAKLPKGPTGLPVLGHILDIVKSPHLKLSKWAQQYGKVYTINFVGQPALVANDVKTIKNVFGSLASTGRFESELFEIMYEGKHGLANSEGHIWQEQHRFCMKALKQFGFGSGSKLDSVILRECDYLCEWIDNQLKITEPGKGLHLSKILLQVTSNTLWNMVTGKRIKSSECEMVHVLEKWVAAFNASAKSGLAFIPWLKYIAPERSGYNEYYKRSMQIRDFIKECFDQHRKMRTGKVSGDAPSDMIDAYLQQVENCTDENSSFYGEVGLRHSFASVGSLLGAGTETTASSLNWLIFYLAAHPQIQTKVQSEVDVIVGADRDPSLNDRPNMPYLDAVILELLRISSLVPFGVIHKLLDSVKFEEFVLPKGLLIIANIYHANYDQNVWGDPEIFRPERFLEGDAAARKILRESVATFQPGKRTCPGEQLSKDVQFLFLAKLLLKYSFGTEDGRTAKEYLEPVAGYLLLPQKIGVVIKPRNPNLAFLE